MDSISLKSLQRGGIILCISIIVLLNSGYALSTTAIGDYFEYVLYISPFILLIPCLNRRCFNKLAFAAFVLFAFLLFLPTAFNYSSSNINSFISLVLKLLFAYEVCSLVDFHTFSMWFRKIFTIISVLSILAYLLLYTSIPELLPSVVNSNAVEYKSAGLFFYIKYATGISRRIQGPFWEPGLLATFVLAAITLEIHSEDLSYKRLAIYVLTVFLSQSSAGILLLLMLGLTFFLRRNNVYSKVFAILIFLGLLVVYINLESIINMLHSMGFEYVNKIVSNDISYTARVDSIIENFSLFLSSPLTGIGPEKVVLYSQGQYATSFFMLASYGLIGSVFTLIPIFSILNLKKLNPLSRLLLCFVFLAVYNKEPHTSLVISYIFIMYGFFSLQRLKGR